MILYLPFVANPETPVVVEPSMTTLHNPSARRMIDGLLFFANLADMREVPHLQHPVRTPRVRLVQAHVLNHDRAGDDDVVDGRLKHLAVVLPGFKLNHAQRVAKPVSQHGLLDAALAPVGGVPADTLAGLVGLGEAGVDALEYPGHLAC